MNMKVIDSIWFSNIKGHCGIVLGEDEITGERKLFAGVVGGGDQHADEIELLSWGNKINTDRLEKLLAKAKEGR